MFVFVHVTFINSKFLDYALSEPIGSSLKKPLGQKKHLLVTGRVTVTVLCDGSCAYCVYMH